LAPTVVSGIWRGLLPHDATQDSRAYAAFSLLAALLMLSMPFLVIIHRNAKLYQLGLHTSHCGRNALIGFVSYFVAAPLVLVTNYCALQFFQRTPHPIEDALKQSPTVENIAANALLAVVFAPVVEELAFRGVLLPWLRQVIGAGPGIVLSSAIFALAHFDAWPAPIALFVLALFLGYLAHRTTSLLAPVVLHATFNGANLAFLIFLIRTNTPFN
jgi:hypothetical protein